MDDPRTFAGIRLGISISGSDLDVPYRYRVDNKLVSDLTVRFASTWLRAGGQIGLGHSWRPGDVMDQIARWAQEFRWSEWGTTQTEDASNRAQILNLFAWPDAPPAFDEKERLELRGVLQWFVIAPPGITTENLDRKSDLGKFARIRALTAMRQQLAGACQARLCIGGAGTNPERRLPGVIEEALFTSKAGKPIYISGALGGASKAMADAILQRRMSDEAHSLFFTPGPATRVMQSYASQYGVPDIESLSSENAWNALAEFQSVPISQLAAQSGLSEEEFLNLLTTPDPERAMAWVIAGIGRLKAAHAIK